MAHLLGSQRSSSLLQSPLWSFSVLGKENVSLFRLKLSGLRTSFSSVDWIPTATGTTVASANAAVFSRQCERKASETSDKRVWMKQTKAETAACFLTRTDYFPRLFSFSLHPPSAYPSAPRRACYTTFSLGSLSRSFVTSPFSSSTSKEEAELSSSSSQSILQDDRSLLGRYSLALFKAALQQSALDKVYADVSNLKMLVTESADFKLFIESPGMDARGKAKVIADLGLKHKFHEVSVNFLKVLLENKRLSQMAKIIDAFEALYRRHNGEVKCVVTSAKELTSSQQKEVISALQKRIGKKAKLIPEFQVQPAIVGGLVVRLGDSMLDFSVNSRVESLHSQLMQPLH